MLCFSFLSITPLALIIGIAAHMIIGMLWYSPLLFGKYWMNLSKIKASSYKMHSGHIAGAAATGGAITLVLGYILKGLGITTCIAAIEYSLLIWLGFVATVLFSPVLWEKKPIELYFIGVAHWAVTFSLISCIVTKL